LQWLEKELRERDEKLSPPLTPRRAAQPSNGGEQERFQNELDFPFEFASDLDIRISGFVRAPAWFRRFSVLLNRRRSYGSVFSRLRRGLAGFEVILKRALESFLVCCGDLAVDGTDARHSFIQAFELGGFQHRREHKAEVAGGHRGNA
jgi:hypothetical protein